MNTQRGLCSRRARRSKMIRFYSFSLLIAGLLFAGCDSDSTNLINDTSSAEGRNGLPGVYSNLKDTPLSNGINPVHLDGRNTLLPFPTDVLAYRDKSSPTGVRIKFTNDNLPPQIGMLPASLQMKNLYREPDGSDCDGFSAATSVLFEFDRAVDSTWVRNEDTDMARDGGDTFYLLDLTTGEFIPALAMESHFAKDRHVATRDYVMQVMARKRFEYGRRYMAFVTSKFKDSEGKDFAPSTGFLKAKSGDGSDISKFYEPWLKFLETKKGISRDGIIAATIFTIRSRQSTVGPLTDMFKTVLEDDFNDANVIITSNIASPIPLFSRVISGKMLVRNFRDQDGVINYTPGFKGSRNPEDKKNWAPFLVFIPNEACRKPYPLNILGSGIGMSKELMVMHAAYNAMVGVASIVIDWPAHGSRIYAEDWSVYEGIAWAPDSIVENGGSMPRLLSMFAQIPIDSMSVYRAVKTYFADSDAEGIRDIDTDNLSYVGISLGALCGTSAAACMPDLKGAFLHVASANFSKVLGCGTFLLGVVGMSMPEGLTGAWFAAGMCAIVGQKGDLFDGIHYAEGFRNGVPEMGTGPRPLAGTYAANDGWVTTEAGVALTEVARLPIVVKQDEVNSTIDFIRNFLGLNYKNTFGEHGNYGMMELSIINPDWNLNPIMDENLLWNSLEGITGHNWYDIAGTLEHALGGASLASAFYQKEWMYNVQCK
jgi:hypothetical protein